MNRKEKAAKVLKKIKEIYPDADTELENWETPFQFLISILLSAQSTDKQVNKVTKKLFKNYPEPENYVKADLAEIQQAISSINYYKNKGKYIQNTAKKIMKEYNEEVPKQISKLTDLPGIGYKSAAVFLAEYYGMNAGIAVDTHVKRVMHRVGIVNIQIQNPDKIAKELEKTFDKNKWHEVNASVVLFGRYICKAKKPKCDECPLTDICIYYKEVISQEESG